MFKSKNFILSLSVIVFSSLLTVTHSEAATPSCSRYDAKNNVYLYRVATDKNPYRTVYTVGGKVIFKSKAMVSSVKLGKFTYFPGRHERLGKYALCKK